MIADVVIVLDEGVDLPFKIAGQVVVVEQDAALQGLVPTLDLALGLRVIRRPTHMLHTLMGRFPVTLYKEQWLKLLDMSAEIRAFIAENEAQLKTKE